ncbi:hypothetical protein ACFQ51_25915 [Streptomyces kaempferi]
MLRGPFLDAADEQQLRGETEQQGGQGEQAAPREVPDGGDASNAQPRRGVVSVVCTATVTATRLLPLLRRWGRRGDRGRGLPDGSCVRWT